MANRPVYVKLSKRPHPHYSYKQIVNEVGEISSNHRGTKRNNISNDTLAPVNNHTWILKPKSRQFWAHFTGNNE